MNIIITEHESHIIAAAPQERLDAFSAPIMRERVYRLLDDDMTKLILDLSAIPFLDSAGLASLVGILKRARQAGGDAKLVWPREKAARRILNLTKFNRVFDTFESTKEAIQKFLQTTKD